MRKILGALLIIFGLSMALLSQDIFQVSTTPKSQRTTFSQLWKQDLIQLEASQKLPAPFFDLKVARITPLNPGAEELLDNLTPPMNVKNDGKYELEVMVDLWEDERGQGALLLYSITDKNKNTIWEMSRTLILN